MTIYLFQLASCAFMTGLIWLIQLLHYPAFLLIEDTKFSDFHSSHSRVISFIVGPIMLLDLCTSIWLVFIFPEEFVLKINLVLLLLTFASTAFLSVPIHSKLVKIRDSGQIRSLVRTNWPRTILWSTRLMGLLWWGALPGARF